MAHQAQFNFVRSLKERLPEFFVGKKVIEIGSLDINGSVRRFFENCDYTGVDVAPGRGVDVVSSGHLLPPELDGQFDVVLSCEMFEHNPLWRETWQRMLDLCKPGGLIFFSCATTGRPEHGTSRTSPSDSPLTVGIGWEYYGNLTADDFVAIPETDLAFDAYEFGVHKAHCDLYFNGIRSAWRRPTGLATPLETTPGMESFQPSKVELTDQRPA